MTKMAGKVCNHKTPVSVQLAVTVPYHRCNSCWFKFFEAKPGFVFGILSVLNYIEELKTTQKIDDQTKQHLYKLFFHGMGGLLKKKFFIYYEEVYKPRLNANK